MMNVSVSASTRDDKEKFRKRTFALLTERGLTPAANGEVGLQRTMQFGVDQVGVIQQSLAVITLQPQANTEEWTSIYSTATFVSQKLRAENPDWQIILLVELVKAS
jgi:hypothetical protein